MKKKITLFLLFLSLFFLTMSQPIISIKLGDQFLAPKVGLDSILHRTILEKARSKLDTFAHYPPNSSSGLVYFTFVLNSKREFNIQRITPSAPAKLRTEVIENVKKANGLWYYDQRPLKSLSRPYPKVLILAYDYLYSDNVEDFKAKRNEEQIAKEKDLKKSEDRFKNSRDTLFIRHTIRAFTYESEISD